MNGRARRWGWLYGASALGCVLGASGEASADPKVSPEGYVEAYVAWNTNRPSNAVTNARGFDDRHATFSLSNAVLGARAELGPVTTRLLLQVGSTPTSYYAAEPRRAGGTASGATDANLWKYVQTATIAWQATSKLKVEGGIFLSPIGVEQMAVKDNFTYSRSNLFFGLPFYHTGLRGSYALSDAFEVGLAAYNGWNSVVDNNEEKSLVPSVTWKTKQSQVQLLYFGGVERAGGAAEGRPWRHTFDLVATYDAASWLSLQAQGDVGFEETRMGTSSWAAVALAARYKLASFLYLAGRVDRFGETVASDGTLAATPIFWSGSPWVSSQTVTLDARPAEQLSVRLELRRDASGRELYYRGQVAGTGEADAPYVPNARTQGTVLLGATAWF